MTDTYSTYEAKAKLSEILRKVERGRTVRISRHGKVIAEVRPVHAESTDLARRIEELSEHGVLVAASDTRRALVPMAHRVGALQRFLSDRNG